MIKPTMEQIERVAGLIRIDDIREFSSSGTFDMLHKKFGNQAAFRLRSGFRDAQDVQEKFLREGSAALLFIFLLFSLPKAFSCPS
jgi:hypothetical protein